ncbi:serpin B3-like [Centruroides vittatus]|uniref:serpin B3-like n=1 Tax=Centruroides vittatus TaxID=120091 RepID=UPI00350FDFB0
MYMHINYLQIAMYWKQSSLVIAIFALFSQVGSQERLQHLAKANNKLCFSLLKTFPAEKNAFFSPVSINTALAMAYGAARGKTAEQMSHVLRYNEIGANKETVHRNFASLINLLDNGSDEYKLKIANAIVSQGDYKILPEYRELLQRNYKALLKEVDFARNNGRAVEDINNWVSQKTNGKISSMVQSLSTLTRMILLNAIYFKGIWKKTFDVDATKNETFLNYGVQRAAVPMMNMKETFPYADFQDEGFRALELPYKGEDIGMVIVLPNAMDGLNKLVNEIDVDKLQDIFSNLTPRKVNIKLPKFKMEDFRELKQSFQSLGMRDAFNGEADFSGISGKRDLHVSSILHKAVIEVNEEGSEAAAATGILSVVRTRSFTSNFFVNRPFLFFIRDRRTDMILFAGRINKL